ncbi:MAG: tetratricopeptide repeat protein [Gammaproteobacteria bacterium]
MNTNTPLGSWLKHHFGGTTFRLGALILAAQLLSACGGSMEGAQEQLQLGQRALDEGRPEAAAAAFLEVIKVDAAHVEAIYQRGRALEALGQWAEAYAHYRRAEDLAPQDSRPALAALDLEVRGAEWERASEHLAKLTLAPGQEQLWAARIAAGTGDHAKAYSLLKPLAETVEADTRVLTDTASAALRSGQDESVARMLLDRALARTPDFGPALTLKSQLELRSGNTDSARDDLAGVHKAEPDNIAVALRLAALHARSGNIDAAIEVYSNSEAVAPDNSRLFQAHGELLTSRARWDELEALVAAAPTNSRRSEGTHNYLSGLLSLGRGDPSAAGETLRKATLLIPDSPSIWFAYGRAALGSGDRTTANLAFEKALTLAPSMLAAEVELARLDLLNLDRRKAEGRIRKLLNAYPEQPGIIALAIRLDLLNDRPGAALAKADQILGRVSEGQAPGAEANDPQVLILKAQALAALDRGEEALAAYRQAMAAGSARAHLEAARLLERLRRPDDARALLDDARTDDPASTTIAKADLLAAKGTLTLRGGNTAEAETLLTQALEADPDQFQANLNLGMLKFTIGDLDTAEKLLARAQAVSPKDPLVHQTLGLIAQARIELDKAEQHYRQALASDASLLLAHTGLAEVYLVVGRPLEALRSAERALNLDPESIRAQLAAASAHGALGELDSARKGLDTLLERSPDEVEARIQRGRLTLRQGDFAAALADFDHALSITPDAGAALIGRVDALERLGRVSEALADLEALLGDKPDNALILRLKGTLLIRTGRAGEAVEPLSGVFAQDPGNPATALLLARAHKGAGHLDQALSILAQALEASATPQPLRMYQAQLQDETGNLEAAIATYRAVLEDNPEYTLALNNLAWALHRHGGSDTEALRLARRAYTTDGSSLAVADTLGVLLNASGDSAEAVKILRSAHERAPANAELRLHLAEAMGAAGDPTGATQLVRELADGTGPWSSEARSLIERLASSH